MTTDQPVPDDLDEDEPTNGDDPSPQTEEADETSQAEG
jgi:hypothetical protein